MKTPNPLRFGLIAAALLGLLVTGLALAKNIRSENDHRRNNVICQRFHV
jgi:hypothetical protein